MRAWRRFTGAVAALVFRRRLDADLDEELQAFYSASVDAKLAAGAPRALAERQARLEIGSRAAVKERVRDVGWESLFETAWYDLTFAARMLARSPAFAAVAIVTLALGTGANAAVFQLLNALRLQALPVDHPRELVSIGIDGHGKPRVGMAFHGAVHTETLWRELRARQQAFSSLLAWGGDTWDFSTNGEMQPARGLYASGGFFDGLGVHAQVGRVFNDADDQPGCATPPAVLSYSTWRARYAGDVAIVGLTISLNRRAVEVVGVTPRDFFGVEMGRTFDVIVPLCAEPLLRGDASASRRQDAWWLQIIGRVKPEWTVDRARAQLAAISPDLFAATVPPTYNGQAAADYRRFTLTAAPAATGVSDLRAQYGTHLWVLLCGTGLVFLITCANLANLMLARATARDRELAIRLAIGGSRGRLVRQMLVESLLLAVAGVCAGFFVAYWLSTTLVAWLSTDTSRIVLNLGADRRTFAVLSVLALVACAIFGVSPALRATAAEPADALQPGGRSGTDSRHTLRLRRALVVGQVAISVVLVVSGMLFARSFQRLNAVELGFDPNVTAASIDMGRAVKPDDRLPVVTRLVDTIRAVPGVTAAAEAVIVPLMGSSWNGRITIGGAAADGVVYFNGVGPDFFRVLDTPVVAGRAFEARDTVGAPLVAVINETFATRYFLGAAALGRRFALEVPPGDAQPSYEVAGIVRDSKYDDIREAPAAIAYLAMRQDPRVWPQIAIVFRAGVPAASVKPAITGAIEAAAPGATVSYDAIGDYVRALLRTDRVMTLLAGFFGVLALLIAVVGLYGVMSYVVARRRVEIGIRMALGAGQRRVVGMMLKESGALLASGAACGVVLAARAARYAARLLYGIDALDAPSFAAATALLGITGLVAAWIPARRASRVAPTVAIRD